ncbi:MAG: ATP-dependent DNA helicase RecG, partial [Actinomycetia bacterium]|nr:ATP-dependent DNA helicase RecG [Actinomycetes bacterium]
ERGMRQMNAPFTQLLEGDSEALSGQIIPIYPSTEGLAQGWIRRIIGQALEQVGELEEVLPDELRKRHGMRTFSEALLAVHNPRSVEDAAAARNRIAYQELFELSLCNAARRLKDSEEADGFAHTIDSELFEKGHDVIGVTLTPDQSRALEDIVADMQRPSPMQRLLIGDVGTGKTFVALFALLMAVSSNTQAAMMAPTEVLAKQYAEKIGPLLDKLDIAWALLTSSLNAQERNDAYARLASGEVAVAFGTHALIQEAVVFDNLTLAIIDEQHRFGVEQRLKFRYKAQVSPDMLAMTATPIPRSLALTVFGDLDISTLHTRPIAGSGVRTHMRPLGKVWQAHEAVKRDLAKGQQAFIVCALIDESTKLEVNAATALAEQLARDEYRDHRVALLHGALKPAEKDAIMEQFRAGQIDVLVATTVIEVGVDIHNVTQMIIYNAERFGLAQLHQLRGRVGRGAIPGEVWLVSDGRSSGAKQRFEALCSTDDGFELADIDLALRGAGDMLGTRQHGAVSFRVADLSRDLPIIELAQRDVAELMDDDPHLQRPQHALLKNRLELLQEVYETWVSAG